MSGQSTALGRNNKIVRPQLAAPKFERSGRPHKGQLNIRNTKAHVAQDDLIHIHERLLTFENLTELPGSARPPKPSQ